MRHSSKHEKPEHSTPQPPSGRQEKPARTGKKSSSAQEAGASQAENRKMKLEELNDREDLSERLFSERNLK